MYSGSGPGGGPGLLPGPVDQLVPHAGGVLGVLAKPLKAAGVAPPLSEFSFHHCAPQNVTGVSIAASPSPITKLPPDVVAKIRILLFASAVLPPSSTILTVTSKNPVEV